MSILDRLSKGRHLDDAALAEVWTDASLAETEPGHAHLAHCARCRARLTAFAAWMDEVRTDGIAEADEAFPAERLAAQHAHILRRLEAAEHPARVITFPSTVHALSPGASHTRRWVTAVAAASLIVGFAVGQMTDLRQALRGGAATDVRSIVPPRSDRPASPIQPVSIATTDPDAVFMAEVDASLNRHSLRELRAIDEFTPRAPFLEGRR